MLTKSVLLIQMVLKDTYKEWVIPSYLKKLKQLLEDQTLTEIQKLLIKNSQKVFLQYLLISFHLKQFNRIEAHNFLIKVHSRLTDHRQSKGRNQIHRILKYKTLLTITKNQEVTKTFLQIKVKGEIKRAIRNNKEVLIRILPSSTKIQQLI